MDRKPLEVRLGIRERDRRRAAALYDLAFGPKLGLAIPDGARRLAVLSIGLQLEYAVAAYRGDVLVGLAGFSTPQGSLTGGIGYRSLLRDLGLVAGHRAVLVLGFYDRKADAHQLLMDGIVVDRLCRGQGIGTALFAELVRYANRRGYATIRLDVIDTNRDAKRLYTRLGFREEKTESFEWLRGLLGFGASTMMVRPCHDEAAMDLGAFSVSLAVKDIVVSRSFYESLGFAVFGGDEAQGWLMMRNGEHVLGLFQGMFEGNLLTFNPGWDQQGRELESFADVRDIQRMLEQNGVEIASGADDTSTGPASITLSDPDGNVILIDQHR